MTKDSDDAIWSAMAEFGRQYMVAHPECAEIKVVCAGADGGLISTFFMRCPVENDSEKIVEQRT
jgi:hypothetical protein